MSLNVIIVEKKATRLENVIRIETTIIMKGEEWNASIVRKKDILPEIVEVQQIEIQTYQHVLIASELDTQSMNVRRSNGMINSEEMEIKDKIWINMRMKRMKRMKVTKDKISI